MVVILPKDIVRNLGHIDGSGGWNACVEGHAAIEFERLGILPTGGERLSEENRRMRVHFFARVSGCLPNKVSITVGLSTDL